MECVNCGYELHEASLNCTNPECSYSEKAEKGRHDNGMTHIIVRTCTECGANIRGCDVPEEPNNLRTGRCGNEAYKWVTVHDDIKQSGTFYICEQHGDIAELIQHLGYSEVGIYQPGEPNCICDYPY